MPETFSALLMSVSCFANDPSITGRMLWRSVADVLVHRTAPVAMVRRTEW